MALGTLASTIAAPLITSGAQFGLSKLFGGGSSAQAPLQQFSPIGINAGGLSTTFENGNINLSPSAARRGLVGDVSQTFANQAGELGQLRSLVAPGFSALTRSRLSELGDRARASIGNLRENLARRRVLGSSFAQDAISRADAEFARMADTIQAESFLQSLDASRQLIDQEFTARRNQFQTGLDELNFEAALAAQLSGKASDQLGANARLEAALNAKEAEGAGKFFGQTFQPAFKAIGASVGDLLKGGFSSGGSSSVGNPAVLGSLY